MRNVTNLDSYRETVQVTAMTLDCGEFVLAKREEGLDLQRLERGGEVIPAKVALRPFAHVSSSASPIRSSIYPPKADSHQAIEKTGYFVISVTCAEDPQIYAQLQ